MMTNNSYPSTSNGISFRKQLYVEYPAPHFTRRISLCVYSYWNRGVVFRHSLLQRVWSAPSTGLSGGQRLMHRRQFRLVDSYLRCWVSEIITSTWWRHQMETFPRYWPFVLGIHRSPVNSPHKGQWRGALIFSLICVWINGWVNNREAGDLRRYRAHYDVTVIIICNAIYSCDNTPYTPCISANVGPLWSIETRFPGKRIPIIKIRPM